VPHLPLKPVLVAGLLALSLAACGRKGPLEPPPNAGAAIELPDAQTGAAETSFGEVSPLSRSGGRGRDRVIPVPDKPFVLDPLL
jgi:predicted small lipoprotein YifL